MVDRPSLLGPLTLLVSAGTTVTMLVPSAKGATLIDWCLDLVCDSFRRAGLPSRARGDSSCSFCRDGRYEDHPFSQCLRTHRETYFSSQTGAARCDAQEGSCSSPLVISLSPSCRLARSAVHFGLGVQICCEALDVTWNSMGLFEV